MTPLHGLIAKYHPMATDVAHAGMLLEIRDEVRLMREEIAALADKVDALSGGAAPPPSLQPTLSRASQSNLAGARDPFFGASLKRIHPMYVIPVSTILAPSFGHFRSHEELK